jgi:hypothetical protein
MAEERKEEMLFQDEKLEDAGKKNPVSNGISASDAAMTRRILLKLDFRCASVLFLIHICLLQRLTRVLPEFSQSSPSSSFAPSSIARMLGMRRHTA